MKNEKIQTGLRIPQERYEQLRELAERSGVSLNAIILFLVDIGLSTINLGVQEASHAEIHTQQHTDEQCIP